MSLIDKQENNLEISLINSHKVSPTKRNNSNAQIVETVGSDSTASSSSPTNMTIINY